MGISKATDSDLEEISALVNTCYRGPESLKGWASEETLLTGIRTTPEELRKDLEDPAMTILKYVDDNTGEIIGCIYYQKKGDEVHSGMLCVRPTLQRNGLGKQLLNAVEDYAKEENCSVLKLDVITVRKPLVEWYKRRGYRETEKLTPFHVFGKGNPLMPLEFMEMEKYIT